MTKKARPKIEKVIQIDFARERVGFFCQVWRLGLHQTVTAGNCIEGKKQVSCQQPSTNRTTSSLKKISTDVMHPNVSNLPGLLLQVVLAVHAVVDHELSFSLCGQTC